MRGKKITPSMLRDRAAARKRPREAKRGPANAASAAKSGHGAPVQWPVYMPMAATRKFFVWASREKVSVPGLLRKTIVEEFERIERHGFALPELVHCAKTRMPATEIRGAKPAKTGEFRIGRPAKGERHVLITLSFSAAVMAALRGYAARNDKRLTALLRELAIAGLDRVA